MTEPMANRSTILRVERALSDQLHAALYRSVKPVSIKAWKIGGEPVSFERARSAQYRSFQIGQSWGAPWDTWWFKVSGTVPEEWGDEADCAPELVVDLSGLHTGIGFQAEGLVHDSDGHVIKALEPLNNWVPVPQYGEPFQYWIEAAANPNINNDGEVFVPTDLGERGVKAGPELYVLDRMELGLLDLQVWHLRMELSTLLGLVRELPEDRTRRADIMEALEQAMRALDPSDIAGSAPQAREHLVPVLSDSASTRSHIVYAVGHAHIDTAWLWPFRETKRKVARTFSNVVQLEDIASDMVFAASSAQQYQWLKEIKPELFERVKSKVEQGRFLPVGGMWVECDANLPSGESLVRQFLYGTKFFEKEFGRTEPIAWLPDSFGYSAALPQIVKLAGMQYFLTQKISWNDTNTFPHNTFLWEGIDGTQVFTHFPPSDTYGAEVTPSEVALSERQYSEKGKGHSSLMLFGWGDGGGGPTREMLESAKLQANLDGSPKVRVADPLTFFHDAEAELADPPVWCGELYLELHRATYTTQKQMKIGNRRNESLLRQAEMWATEACVKGLVDYPYEELESIWHDVLLLQFHDVLPGSAIAWVHDQAREMHANITVKLESIIDRSLSALVGQGDKRLLANAGPFTQQDVSATGISQTEGPNVIPVTRVEDTYVFDNGRVRYIIDQDGQIISGIDLSQGRETIASEHPANVLQLFKDFPAEWDAWDIDKSYPTGQLDEVNADDSHISENSRIEVHGHIGKSPFTQTIWLDNDSDSLTIQTDVDWKESNRLLKLAFPVIVSTKEAVSEIQFGHLARPISTNTSWDEARFETSAQRWVQVGEPNFKISIANNNSYGHDIRQLRTKDGEEVTQIRVTLLRSPHYPDPNTDVGQQSMTVSFRIGSSVDDAIRQGYRLNVPVRQLTGAHGCAPLLNLEGDGVVIEAIKMAEDGIGDVIVRLYEAHGNVSRASLHTSFPWNDVREVGLLERPCDAVRPAISNFSTSDRSVNLVLKPYQIVTLRIQRP